MKNWLLHLIITGLLALFLCQPALALDLTGRWEFFNVPCNSGCDFSGKPDSWLGTIYITQDEDDHYSGKIYTSESKGTCNKFYIHDNRVTIYCHMEDDSSRFKESSSLDLMFSMIAHGGVNQGNLDMSYKKKYYPLVVFRKEWPWNP